MPEKDPGKVTSRYSRRTSANCSSSVNFWPAGGGGGEVLGEEGGEGDGLGVGEDGGELVFSGGGTGDAVGGGNTVLTEGTVGVFGARFTSLFCSFPSESNL